MTRTSRRLAVGTAAGLALLLLAGCGDGPVRAGSAAVVGDERIEADELEAVVERGLEAPEAQQQFGADRADFQRQVLNRMVRAALLEQAADERGVEITQGEVDAQLGDFAEQAGGREALEEQAAAGGISPTDLPRFAREVVLEIALADQLTEDLDVAQEDLQAVYEQGQAQFARARSRHILVPDEAQARDLLAQVQADPSRFAALAAEFSTDESNKDQGGDLGTQPAGSFVPEFDAVVFEQPLEEPTVVQTQFGWHVVEVLEREVTSLAEAEPELRRAVLAQEREDRLTEELRSTAERLGVTVNPRFGRWDAEAVEVAAVPADDGLSSPAPSSGPDTGGAPVDPGQAPVDPGQAPVDPGQAPADPGGTVEEGQPAPENSPAS